MAARRRGCFQQVQPPGSAPIILGVDSNRPREQRELEPAKENYSRGELSFTFDVQPSLSYLLPGAARAADPSEYFGIYPMGSLDRISLSLPVTRDRIGQLAPF